MRGKPLSEAQRDKLRALWTPERRAERSRLYTGRKASPETVEKMRAGMRKAWEDPVKRERMLNGRRARKAAPPVWIESPSRRGWCEIAIRRDSGALCASVGELGA